MHPLVRDLYKRVVFIGRDYPTGWPHVQSIWKNALRNPDNCPSWYSHNNNNNHALSSHENGGRSSGSSSSNTVTTGSNNEEELLRAVHRGRLAVKEMIGVIQLKKYRHVKQRYDRNEEDQDYDTIR
jgi:hypothetical protein